MAIIFPLVSIQAVISFMVFVSFFILLKRRVVVNPRLSTKACLPPGPKPWPIIGNLYLLINNKPFSQWIHDAMSKMSVEIFCIRLGNVHVIAVTSPEISCEFLKKHDLSFASRPNFLSAELVSKFSTAALTPMGDQWKKMRRVLVSNILSPTSHKWMHEKRVKEVDHLVRYVWNLIKGNNGVVNVRVVTQHFCTNVIRQMIFSKRFFGEGTLNEGPGVEEEEHVDGLFKILKYLYSFSISDYVPFLRRRLDLDGHEKAIMRALKSINKYQDPEIDSRIKQWKDGTRQKKDDFLDVLITLQDNNENALLTRKEIKAQIMEIMIATIDNPSNAVEWIIGEMINNTEILVKAIQELDQVVGKDRLVQESDIPKLNYIKACIRESFRIHPMAPFNVPHVSMCDTMVSGYFIPEGSHVLLSRIGLGRNPRIWDEPLLFKPERHLKDDKSQVILTDPDLRLLSFSIGRRGCPGVNLGSTMSIMLLARLLQAFTWCPLPNTSCVNLMESKDDMSISKPLHAFAIGKNDAVFASRPIILSAEVVAKVVSGGFSAVTWTPLND
ncbi:isoleucine N-monooxygenase 1-like [Impatiens glandulifera]|uniref:isoleucine N-monooxygenase 1-like n=1 Tax=Impatiens glandulifera TaxID=253017 RepID=UPI001FB0970F|nr:isoleucine N-monooxygenase 1-like [Impatiens glandulifera]